MAIIWILYGLFGNTVEFVWSNPWAQDESPKVSPDETAQRFGNPFIEFGEGAEMSSGTI
jgi:hypothetical protein